MIGTIFKAFGRQHLDVTLNSGSGYSVRIVEAPGRWMSEEALNVLGASLRQIAGKTLSANELTYGVFSGKKEALESTIITVVTRDDGTPIAFNALATIELDLKPRPIEVLHLGLVMVDPDERSKNLSWVLYGLTCFLIFFRRQFRPVWISNVTQVPSVVGMVTEMFSEVWPQPGPGRRTLNHLLIAREIMRSHRHIFGVGSDARFDQEHFIIEDAYTGGSDGLKKKWEEAPKHRLAHYNDYCQERLNYDRGDDFLQVGLMDLAAMRGYLSREVPKSSVFGLLLTAGLVTLRRLLLPTIHWLDATQEWNSLRPYKGRKS